MLMAIFFQSVKKWPSYDHNTEILKITIFIRSTTSVFISSWVTKGILRAICFLRNMLHIWENISSSFVTILMKNMQPMLYILPSILFKCSYCPFLQAVWLQMNMIKLKFLSTFTYQLLKNCIFAYVY